MLSILRVVSFQNDKTELDNSLEGTGKKKGRQTGKHTNRIGSHTPFCMYFVVYRQPASWPV